jgi:hypothetical protein
MTLPLIALAILSLVGGFMHHSEGGHEEGQSIMIASVVVALIGAAFAFFRYRKFDKEEMTNQFVEKGLGIDVFYNKFFGNTLKNEYNFHQIDGGIGKLYVSNSHSVCCVFER